MEIKVLGPGCANCNKLEKVVAEAAKEMGITDPVQKVSDIQQILSYGVMSTPALVVDGKVNSRAGFLPKKRLRNICKARQAIAALVPAAVAVSREF
jgi:small redox-active disulfide protein 2